MRGAAAVAMGVLLSACAARSADVPPRVVRAAPRAAAPAALPSPSLASMLPHGAELVLTLHPAALTRDPVYGPLLRRAAELASAYAGPTNLGTTTLAVLARTDEVVVVATDHGRDAAVALRGVPAAIDPLEVVDTAGRPVWHAMEGDSRSSSRELAPADGSGAALFVAPGRVWIAAIGSARASVRAALVNGVASGAFAGDETALMAISLRGDALPQLRRGALAPVGEGLLRVRLELTAGSEGVIVARLEYADAASAAKAEGTVLEVTLAFRHRLEEAVRAADAGTVGGDLPRPGANAPRSGPLDWLGAARVERTGSVLVVRAPIPRPWLDALAHAELPAPGP